jgi:hypothetical protein
MLMKRYSSSNEFCVIKQSATHLPSYITIQKHEEFISRFTVCTKSNATYHSSISCLLSKQTLCYIDPDTFHSYETSIRGYTLLKGNFLIIMCKTLKYYNFEISVV